MGCGASHFKRWRRMKEKSKKGGGEAGEKKVLRSGGRSKFISANGYCEIN